MKKQNKASSAPQIVTIYCDGSCLCNPGAGGYGAVILANGERKELRGGYRLTTSSRAEIMAAIKGLEALEAPSAVKLHSDSQYLVLAFTEGRLQKWERNGWTLANGKAVKNIDLWLRLLEQCRRHSVTFVWVQGHAGHRLNEAADRLAKAAAALPDLPSDDGYEALQQKAV